MGMFKKKRFVNRVFNKISTPTVAGGVSVIHDVNFENAQGSHGTSYSFTSSGGNVAGTPVTQTNQVLIAMVGWITPTPGTVTVRWDTGGTGGTTQTMTPVGAIQSFVGATFTMYVCAYYVVAPNVGARIIEEASSGDSSGIWLGAMTLYNVNQTTPVQNVQWDTGTGTAANSTVTSANGNMAVCCHLDDNWNGLAVTNGATSAFIDTRFDGNAAMCWKASTTTSTTLGFDTGGISKAWGNVAFDVVAG